MKIAYVICRMIVNLAFIVISVGLSIYTNNYNFLWFLVIPGLSHLTGMTFTDKAKIDNDEDNR